jgi:copper-binding protein NosD
VEISNNLITNQANGGIIVEGHDYIQGYADGLISPIIIGNDVDGDTYSAITTRRQGVVTAPIIDNNVCSGYDGYGVLISSASTPNPVIRYNDISVLGNGIACGGPNAVISYNDVRLCQGTVWGATQGGIVTTGQGNVSPLSFEMNPSNAMISFNVLYGNKGYGVLLSNDVANGDNITVRNNTIVGNDDSGLLIQTENAQVYNNIIALHSGAGIQYEAANQGAIGYNLHYNTILSGVDFAGFPGSTVFPGDLFVTPSFVSIPGADFHLQASSLAIGAGASLSGTTFTPNGSDLGAYTFQTQSTAVPNSAWEMYR